jgi:hypothetical protein
VDDAKNLKQKGSRSASADKRQKAAEILNDETARRDDTEEFIDDTMHKIETKEDLFAAIGDTSLTTGKRLKQRGRRKTAEVSKEEIQKVSKYTSEKQDEADNVNKVIMQQKSRTSSQERPKDFDVVESQADENTSPDKRTLKSRTASRERPKDLDNIELQNDEPTDTSKRTLKSRTTSKERPKDLDTVESQKCEPTSSGKRTLKSRTTSKGRPKDLDTVESQKDEPTDTGKRILKSRTASKERPKDLDIVESQQNEPTVISKRTAKSRTASKE